MHSGSGHKHAPAAERYLFSPCVAEVNQESGSRVKIRMVSVLLKVVSLSFFLREIKCWTLLHRASRWAGSVHIHHVMMNLTQREQQSTLSDLMLFFITAPLHLILKIG